jgi:endonuclease/exonuclease/phosphatase family metal-dependent hydrolase
MRLASFNVENLFARPRVFHRGDWSEGAPVLSAYGRVASLLEEPTYTSAIRKKIVAGLKDLGLAKSDEAKFVVLRQNRGRLVKRTAAGPQIAAGGRADWVGWLELKMQLASELCVQNTARVVSELNPDVIAVIEADNRPALKQFSGDFVPAAPGPGQDYKYVMLIDGNDDRGIDVGIMSRGPYPITDMASHVDDADDAGVIFSRDCAEFVIRTPAKHNLLVMVNHLKSKGYGAQGDSDARRRRQALRVADIYLHRRKHYPYVAVVGDFNDTPSSAPLAPLFDATDLRDITEHPTYISDGIPGTWGKGYTSNHIDFILLSPALFNRVKAGATFRAGVWDDRKTPKWQVFDTITRAEDAASDHAAVWADVNV